MAGDNVSGLRGGVRVVGGAGRLRHELRGLMAVDRCRRHGVVEEGSGGCQGR